jgi:hypothetical protein
MKPKPRKNKSAVALGRRRMSRLTKAQRRELGRQAANARWNLENKLSAAEYHIEDR